MNKNQQKKALALGLIAVVSLVVAIKITPKILHKIEIAQIQNINEKALSEAKNSTSAKKDTPKAQNISQQQTTAPLILEPQITELPKTAYLENVPFFCQAPLQTEKNWLLHEESCEEAALLQAYLYETNQTMTKEEANEKILDMIAWQEENFGGHFDLHNQEMKSFIIKYLNLEESQVRLIKKATLDDLRREIANGHPVIVPITGEILKNPHYPYPGYHMLTVTGFTEERIITNDNGTRHGQDYSYSIEVFEKAMKDAGSDIFILDMN